MKKIISSILLLLLLITCGCRKEENKVEETRFLMDTPITITVTGNQTEDELKVPLLQAFNVMQTISDENDRYNNSAPNGLYALNNWQKNEPFSPGDYLFNLLQMEKNQPFKELDITVGSLVDLWQKHKAQNTLPTKEELAIALKTVGLNNYILDKEKRTVTLNKGTIIDVGAIAKGYSVDEAYKVLQKNKNITSALINAGGTIKVLGQKLNGKPWKIGVQDPRKEKEIIGTVELKEGEALATSGDYQRYYEVNGVRYHHILDPKTGEPSRNAISVTVLSTSALTSDFFSTLLFVLPKDEAIKIIEETPQISALLIYGSDDLYISKNFSSRFKKSS